MKLKYEKWSGALGVKGTIRTNPENYYVCDVLADNTLEFRGLETLTRDFNQKEIHEWWENHV